MLSRRMKLSKKLRLLRLLLKHLHSLLLRLLCSLIRERKSSADLKALAKGKGAKDPNKVKLGAKKERKEKKKDKKGKGIAPSTRSCRSHRAGWRRSPRDTDQTATDVNETTILQKRRAKPIYNVKRYE